MKKSAKIKISKLKKKRKRNGIAKRQGKKSNKPVHLNQQGGIKQADDQTIERNKSASRKILFRNSKKRKTENESKKIETKN